MRANNSRRIIYAIFIAAILVMLSASCISWLRPVPERPPPLKSIRATCYDYNSTDTPITILPGGARSSYIDVSDRTGESAVEMRVTFNITHANVSDLTIYVAKPDGGSILVVNRVGGTGDNFVNTTLDNDASTNIADGSAPFTGSYRPLNPLYTNVVANGTWRLWIWDWTTPDTGTLDSWTLTLCTEPFTPTPTLTFTPTATDIPGNCTVYVGNDVPKIIPDDTITYTLSALPIAPSAPISKIDVTFSMDHENWGDLDIWVCKQYGQHCTLIDGNIYASGHYTMTFSSDPSQAEESWYEPPFTGSYQAEQPLSGFLGEDTNGNWGLVVRDSAYWDLGSLTYWEMVICTDPGYATATPTPTSTPRPGFTPSVQDDCPVGYFFATGTNCDEPGWHLLPLEDSGEEDVVFNGVIGMVTNGCTATGPIKTRGNVVMQGSYHPIYPGWPYTDMYAPGVVPGVISTEETTNCDEIRLNVNASETVSGTLSTSPQWFGGVMYNFGVRSGAVEGCQDRIVYWDYDIDLPGCTIWTATPTITPIPTPIASPTPICASLDDWPVPPATPVGTPVAGDCGQIWRRGYNWLVP